MNLVSGSRSFSGSRSLFRVTGVCSRWLVRISGDEALFRRFSHVSGRLGGILRVNLTFVCDSVRFVNREGFFAVFRLCYVFVSFRSIFVSSGLREVAVRHIFWWEIFFGEFNLARARIYIRCKRLDSAFRKRV